MARSVAETVRRAWRRLAPLPGGKLLFSRLLWRMIPYTATVRPYVVALEPGYARIAMRDRRRVRNHLDSIHAIALANLGEVTSGLAMTIALPAHVRAIVVGLEVDYRKKARGTLIAECRTSMPQTSVETEHIVHADIRDRAGDVVASVRARWLIRPMSPAR